MKDVSINRQTLQSVCGDVPVALNRRVMMMDTRFSSIQQVIRVWSVAFIDLDESVGLSNLLLILFRGVGKYVWFVDFIGCMSLFRFMCLSLIFF